MGAGVSQVSSLQSSEQLAGLVGPDHIPPSDPYWQRLLSFNLNPPNNNEEQVMLDAITEPLLQQLAANNPRSGNIGSLVQVFLTRATELLASPGADNAILSWQTFNCLFVIRCIGKYLVETVSEPVLRQHFHSCWETEPQLQAVSQTNHSSSDKINGNLNGPQDDSARQSLPVQTNDNVSGPSPLKQDGNERISNCPDQINGIEVPTETLVQLEGQVVANSSSLCLDGPLEMLMDALFGLIIDVPVTDNTYYLHLEAINTLLVLLSVHIFSMSHSEVITPENSHIYKTVFGGRYSLHAGLLIKALLRDMASLRPPPPPAPSGSIVLGLASSIWSIMSGSRWRSEDLESGSHRMSRPAASQACLLALALVNHSTQHNLYREALFSCQDVQQAGALGVDFGMLYVALGKSAEAEQVTLLLYLLLHRNRSFRNYLMARPDLHTLVVPIMKTLYEAAYSSSHHIYMSLIVLLILSEDDNFNRSIHEMTLRNITWYTERTIPEISLGGLLVLVIIRTVQFNMLRMRDKYLHTNCLAALANMSSEFRNLHPYVAQRLVSLFETLSRRHTRLAARAHVPLAVPATPTSSTPATDVHLDLEHAEEVLTDEMREELLQDMGVVEEVLRMVLEIINSCLTAQLRTNIHLVYTLLHKRALFHRYRTHPAFQDLIQNIEMVVGYFSARLQRAQEQRGTLGAAEVLAVVTRAADHWSTDRLRKFPELKFRYVEEEQPEEFFTPYVWSLVCAHGAIRWATGAGLPILADMAC